MSTPLLLEVAPEIDTNPTSLELAKAYLRHNHYEKKSSAVATPRLSVQSVAELLLSKANTRKNYVYCGRIFTHLAVGT